MESGGAYTFPLMSLPAELRNRIYSWMLKFWNLGSQYTTVNTLKWPLPCRQLLLLSKQIRAEVLPIFYGQNCFDMYINYSHENVSDIHTWDSWSEACSALRSHVKRIRCLSLWYQDGPMSDPANDYLCFVIRNGYYRDFDPGGSYKNFVEPEQRVGYDDTDWSQAQEVLGCVRRTVNRLKPRFTSKQSRRRLLVKVAKALSEFARHCGGGKDLWIELICDREQYDTDMEDITDQEDVC